MITSYAPFVAFLGLVVGALGAYLAAARRLSGRVRTSDAAELWKESSAIRRELEERNRYLSIRLDKLSDELNVLRQENARLLRLVNGATRKDT
jgi:Flp pilus assembly protein TadB